MMKRIKIVKKKTEYLVFDKDYSERIDLKYTLTEKYAELELFVLFLGNGKHSVDCNIEIIHQAPGTKSLVRFRSALFEDFHLEAFGRVTIEKSAQGSEAFLEMRSLLFGEKSKARLDPILDIRNNNVKASHAAAIGRIQEEDLFYLRSRGLAKKKAEKIFLKEYFMPVESQKH